ncbi:MAG: hypothetical protein ACREYC_00865 [Gammaproteobacteria bacterium]
MAQQETRMCLLTLRMEEDKLQCSSSGTMGIDPCVPNVCATAIAVGDAGGLAGRAVTWKGETAPHYLVMSAPLICGHRAQHRAISGVSATLSLGLANAHRARLTRRGVGFDASGVPGLRAMVAQTVRIRARDCHNAHADGLTCQEHASSSSGYWTRVQGHSIARGAYNDNFTNVT